MIQSQTLIFAYHCFVVSIWHAPGFGGLNVDRTTNKFCDTGPQPLTMVFCFYIDRNQPLWIFGGTVVFNLPTLKEASHSTVWPFHLPTGYSTSITRGCEHPLGPRRKLSSPSPQPPTAMESSDAIIVWKGKQSHSEYFMLRFDNLNFGFSSAVTNTICSSQSLWNL